MPGGFWFKFMEITKEQYEKIAPYLPTQRGNVRISNWQMLNALLYMAENGCKWRGLPAHFGQWSTIHQRMLRWSKSGVLCRVFEALKEQRNVPPAALSMDSTSIKVPPPDGTGALKKTARNPSEDPAADGIPRFIWLLPASAKQ